MNTGHSTVDCPALLPPLASRAMTRVILAWLRSTALNTRAGVDPVTGARTATYPTAIRVVGWILLAVGIGVAALVAMHNPPLNAALIDAPILALTLTLVLELTRVRVEWDDAEVRVASPWSRRRGIRWEEIVGVEYSKSAQWTVLRGRTGVKIRLSDLLGGVGDLVEEMKRRGYWDERRWVHARFQ
jgi:hypothetical protein